MKERGEEITTSSSSLSSSSSSLSSSLLLLLSSDSVSFSGGFNAFRRYLLVEDSEFEGKDKQRKNSLIKI